ncbi:MAG: alpha/beta hydrolase [Gemmataceae bacterium]
MQVINWLRLSLAVAMVCLAVLTAPPSIQAQAAKKGKSITVRTFDGVDLSGTHYPNTSGKRDAVAILMHHFDKSKGGSSSAEGWSQLVNDLLADGYTVINFDFRGFGDSKNVDKEKFWKYSHNTANITGKRGETIDYKNFRPNYYPYLVNDLAAIKAYLDRRNDARELNSGNILLIGAGDAAAVGNLWLAHESKRRRDKSGGAIGAMMALGEPEVKDVAAAIWLSPTSKIGAKTVPLQTLQKWAAEAGKVNKVPMAIVYGSKDATSLDVASKLYNAIKGGAKPKEFPHTVLEKIPDTNQKYADLLTRDNGGSAWIVKKYLPKVMEDRGAVERIERDIIKSPYYYQLTKNGIPQIQKAPGLDVAEVNLKLFWPGLLGP